MSAREASGALETAVAVALLTARTTILAAALLAAATTAQAADPWAKAPQSLDEHNYLRDAGISELKATLKPPTPPPVKPNVTWQELEGLRTWLDGDKPMRVTHTPPSRQLVPPEQFDGPYKGKLTVTVVDSEAEVMKQCPATVFPAKLGCAWQFRALYTGGPYAECRIILANQAIAESWGFTFATIYRHELGHCNGWAGDHKGARFAQ